MSTKGEGRFFNRGQLIFWIALVLIVALPFLRITDLLFDEKDLLERLTQKEEQPIAEEDDEEPTPDDDADLSPEEELMPDPDQEPRPEDELGPEPEEIMVMTWEWDDFNREHQKISFSYGPEYIRSSKSNRLVSFSYASLYDHDRHLLTSMIGEMKKKIKKENWNYIQALEYVCSSIQYIPYTLVLPTGIHRCPCIIDGESFSSDCVVQSNGRGCCNNVNPFGVYAPFEFVYKKTGDCDTRALLAFTLLKQMGFDVAVMTSESMHHSVLGVYMPNKGNLSNGRNSKGKKYVLWELTSPYWRLGMEVQGKDWIVALE
jgi:hypothetical protein